MQHSVVCPWVQATAVLPQFPQFPLPSATHTHRCTYIRMYMYISGFSFGLGLAQCMVKSSAWQRSTIEPLPPLPRCVVFASLPLFCLPPPHTHSTHKPCIHLKSVRQLRHIRYITFSVAINRGVGSPGGSRLCCVRVQSPPVSRLSQVAHIYSSDVIFE